MCGGKGSKTWSMEDEMTGEGEEELESGMTGAELRWPVAKQPSRELQN